MDSSLSQRRPPGCTVVFSGKGYVHSQFEFQNRKGEGEDGAAESYGGGSSFEGCDGSGVAGELGWLGRCSREWMLCPWTCAGEGGDTLKR
ncbi:hypothetical protein VIGAN_07145600 [Vigna angularis var. angularis]|uniref:Uncharacterized protein n=1 Tax=Vigna angularis var. angularis TaxID=157739 RepID=A0A0S3SII4_PHAAN|nr:hypothetical protein VIGAN_07145600 [Vigna angularis var. angularis]